MKNINKTDQKELLDKFYNGETSLDEEKLLETGDDQLSPEKDLFRFFESERKVAPPSFPVEKLDGGHSFLFAAKLPLHWPCLFCSATFFSTTFRKMLNLFGG